MTDRCEKGSPCIYQSRFELKSKYNGTFKTCGQHLNHFLNEIYSKNPDEVVEIRLL